MSQLRNLGEFEVLRSFLAVAEELNFRRAAARLHIDQSALTRRIQNLEHELGFKLFERSTKAVNLTEAGRVFFEDNHRLLATLQRTIERARAASEGKSGRLRLGYMAFAATSALPVAVRAFSRAYPEVRVEPSYSRTQAQKLALARGEADAGFIIGPFAHAEFDGLTVAREPLRAMVPADHHLAKRRTLRLADVAGSEIVLGTMQEWDYYRWWLDDVFAARGLTLRPALEAPSSLGILGLVSGGLGLTVMPEGMALVLPENVAMKPIVDCTEHLETMLVWSRNHRPPHLLNFIETCRAAFAT